MAAEGTGKQNLIAAILLSLFLMYGLADAIFVRAGEFPMPPAHFIDMGIDAAATLVLAIGVISSFNGGKMNLPPAVQVLGIVGVLCGLGQLAIRLSSDHGWWTGHLSR